MAFEINGVTQPSQAVEEWTDEDIKRILDFWVLNTTKCPITYH